MNTHYQAIESRLIRAGAWWRLLHFAQRMGVATAGVSLVFLLLGAACTQGWITSRWGAGFLFAVATIVSLAVLLVLAAASLTLSVQRGWLAAMLERARPGLLDRLNTLIYLETQPTQGPWQAFRQRIAGQAGAAVKLPGTRPTFPLARPLISAGIGLTALAFTIWYYSVASPWSQVAAAEAARRIPAVEPEKPAELALPATNSVERQLPWGEVRITEPGADQKVTKVDVVPLQIEAAANEALRQVAWNTTVNGGAERTNNLPPPAEPRYAVYQPTLYLDELRLADWDVVTYYARAATDQQSRYASQVYFLEVRPFREDILKLPGGEEGQAYQVLSELTALIEQQQHVIRETHRFSQQPEADAKVRGQDRQKLAAAEDDLSDSARHAYAEIATRMENKPIGEALDSLAKAEQTLAQASQLLGQDNLTEAQNRERQALAELVATRKMFQKSVSENPQDFNDQKPEKMPPVAEDAKRLQQMAEFRDEAKAAQEFVQKTRREQEQLGQQLQRSPRMAYANSAERQRQLAKSLEEFQQQHPQPFKDAGAETREAKQAMAKAAQEMQKNSAQTPALAEQAVNELKELGQAMQQQSLEQQLTDAYKLKQMLERQAETFGQCERSGGGMPSGQVKDTAVAAQQTLAELQRLANQAPTRDAFGQPLRDALSRERLQPLDEQLRQLQQVNDALRKKVGSGEAQRMMSEVSKAFDQSQPKSLQAARKQDALKPDSQQSLARGMAQLQGLIERMEQQRELLPQDQQRQSREAARNFQDALRELPSDRAEAAELAVQLDKVLKGEMPMDLEVLKKLAAELQRFSTETTVEPAEKPPAAQVGNIDPDRLPPAYRGRIQKYFQKLSEK
jgi:hypothetical protein